IKKDASDVWIVASVSPAPKDLAWEQDALSHVLNGAKVLFLPPQGRVGIFEGVWFLIMNGDILRLPDGERLEQTLPVALKDRFVATRTLLHRDEDRYAEYKASVAGFRLEGDYLQWAKLDARGVTRSIEALAARDGVPVRRVAIYPALEVVREVPTL